jgi:hypothetical protein
MASDFSVAWQCLSKRTIGFLLWIKLHAHPLGECLLCEVYCKITETAHISGLLISTVRDLNQFWQKTGWSVFWAAFSQTHLVTMLLRYTLAIFYVSIGSQDVETKHIGNKSWKRSAFRKKTRGISCTTLFYAATLIFAPPTQHQIFIELDLYWLIFSHSINFHFKFPFLAVFQFCEIALSRIKCLQKASNLSLWKCSNHLAFKERESLGWVGKLGKLFFAKIGGTFPQMAGWPDEFVKKSPKIFCSPTRFCQN